MFDFLLGQTMNATVKGSITFDLNGRRVLLVLLGRVARARVPVLRRMPTWEHRRSTQESIADGGGKRKEWRTALPSAALLT